MSKHPNQHLFAQITPEPVTPQKPGHRCSVRDQVAHQFTYEVGKGMVYKRPASKAWMHCQETRQARRFEGVTPEAVPLDEPIWTAEDWNGKAA